MSGFIGSGVTVACAYLVYVIRRGQFAGWSVVVNRGEEKLCKRPVGRRKAEEVLDDPSTLSVFIKGICSPFGWLNEDVLSAKAAETGLFRTDYPGKYWIVDMAKNPPKKKNFNDS